MDLRNRATHFALFTTVSELKIRFFAMHQHTIGVSVTTIYKVATRTKGGGGAVKIFYLPLCFTVTENCS